MSPYITRCKTHAEAVRVADYQGGVILTEEGGFIVCHGCKEGSPCECRDTDWIKSLAPSWDESAPENANRDQRNIPQQGSLI